MAVFGIVTTGFVTAATYCYRAQTKANRNLKETNQQTTNLEHFSNYSSVIDPGEYNLEFMETGTNLWTMVYNFPGYDIKNDKVSGYISQTSDEVFQLGFFSPIERVSLDANEYWINMNNVSTSQTAWYFTTVSGFVFFNNQKDQLNPPSQTESRIFDTGAVKKIGIRDVSGGDLSQALEIHDANTGDVVAVLDLTTYADSERYCNIYYDGSGFLTQEEYDARS